VTGGTAYDAWASSRGLDPSGNGARGADADGDGYSNWREFMFGTAPGQATHALWRQERQAGGLLLSFVGRQGGAVYRLMSTTDLVAGPWREEFLEMSESADQEGVPPGYRRQQLVVPNAAGNRFFRLQAEESAP